VSCFFEHFDHAFFISTRITQMEIKEIESQPVMTVRTTTTASEIGKAFHDILPAVWQHVMANGGAPVGPPFCLYHGYSPETVDLEAGVPVAAPIAESDLVKAGELPAGTVATAWHLGSYDNLHDTYMTLEKEIKEQGYEASGSPWEIYWTDPGKEPVENWKTEIRWPVKKAEN
jgi:effector-binding domain-containing protein